MFEVIKFELEVKKKISKLENERYENNGKDTN